MSFERAPQQLRWIVAVLVLLPTTARAQGGATPDPVASALFREGRDLIKKGNWEEGCPKIDASMKRFPAPSTLLNLALCREHEGRVATAWAMAQRARVLNRDTVGDKRRTSLDAAGRKLIDRLEPLLPRLRIKVAPAGVQAKLTEDGRDFPANTAVPLDPGMHTVIGTAPNHRDVTRQLELVEGVTLEVVMDFEPLPVAHPTPVPEPEPPPEPTPAPVTADAPIDDDVPLWIWITGGAGLVLGGVSIAFTIDAVNASSSLEDTCGPDLVCNEDLTFNPEPLNDRKNRSTALAVAFGAGGALGIVSSIVGLAVWGASSPTVAAWSTPTSGGLSLAGSF